MMEEIWKTIKDFPNYEVSNMGNVRSVIHKDRFGRKQGGHVLTPQADGRGLYLHVGLRKDGKVIYRNVHRLVAITFIDNPHNYPEVNHKDENKKNNAVSNLEWCTHQYNNVYGTRFASTRGTKNPMNKFDDEIIMFIKKNHKFCGGSMRNKDLAKMFNMSPTHVCSIAHGRRWKHADPV